ncbi:Hypothetical predicted protein [Octopus vulgaris]|uniref:Uncharacterized protein n=1 Tax=Octopus vulgaris TaxID=6645 RepID=A0AA36F0V8_OCTVU|nr:Hypothetical predicted protein [Octopus vulgaris]
MAADGEPVYCLCRLPYDDTRFMIECDVCNDWFHGKQFLAAVKSVKLFHFSRSPDAGERRMFGNVLHTGRLQSCLETDPLQKLTVYHKARKICYQRSLVNAFSKILVLVLPNGKICAELNTSKPDIYCAETFETNLLQINELDQEPEVEADGNEENTIHEGTLNLDALNIQLLQELEDV